MFAENSARYILENKEFIEGSMESTAMQIDTMSDVSRLVFMAQRWRGAFRFCRTSAKLRSKLRNTWKMKAQLISDAYRIRAANYYRATGRRPNGG